MVKKVLDLHLHSKYAQACSPLLELENIAKVCEIKGVDIVSTADFTHPLWLKNLKEKLVEDTEGIYKLKSVESKTRFFVSTELAVIQNHKGKTRKVHVLILSPNLEVAEKFTNKLLALGYRLDYDGRPILGTTCKELLKVCLDVDERMMLIPAHAWTPWFGILGSKSGYESMEEAFEEMSDQVFAFETGFGTNPEMNWRIPSQDPFTILSFSDAHSLDKIAREATVMGFDTENTVTYKEICRIIKENDPKKLLYTIEFFPQEGKYFGNGHRKCKFSCSYIEAKRLKEICPVCKRPMTIGTEYQVEEKTDRSRMSQTSPGGEGRIHFKNIVPQREIISEILGKGVGTKTVGKEYDNLVNNCGNELEILLDLPIENIQACLPLILQSGAVQPQAGLPQAIENMRAGDVKIQEGFDGVYGKIGVL